MQEPEGMLGEEVGRDARRDDRLADGVGGWTRPKGMGEGAEGGEGGSGRRAARASPRADVGTRGGIDGGPPEGFFDGVREGHGPERADGGQEGG